MLQVLQGKLLKGAVIQNPRGAQKQRKFYFLPSEKLGGSHLWTLTAALFQGYHFQNAQSSGLHYPLQWI
jgi:hypothetical protein